MSLKVVQIKDVRNIESVSFHPSSGLNVIVGPNGSGKTSLLESLYILSRARSFRTHNIRKVLSYDKKDLVVFAELSASGVSSKIAIKKNQQETTIKINGHIEQKASELSRHLHTHLIRPESQSLLENGATSRRSFIDLGVFHVKHSFLKVLKQHNQVLKQRNTLLKSKQLDTLPIWSNKLVEYGTMVSEQRAEYVNLLEKELRLVATEFFGDIEFSIKYLSGWDKNLTLTEVLARNLNRDIQYGYTTAGAHKSDIKVFVNNKLAQDFLSRGQMKLLVIALYLSQIKLMSKQSYKSVCVLLDDLAAELDEVSFKKVMFFLKDLGIQIFVTTTNKSLFSDFIKEKETKLFHVKHGVMHIEDS